MAFLGCVDALSMGSVVLPFAYVLLPLPVLPKPVSLHRSVLKVPDKVLLAKSQQAMSVRSIIGEIPVVDGAVGKNSVSLAHFVVKTEMALVEGIFGEEHAQSMAQVVFDSTEVQVLLGSNHLVAHLLRELLFGKVVLAELVVLGVDCGEIVGDHIEVGSMDIQVAEMVVLQERLSHNFIRD
jgi:hypothetical protein